MSMTDENVPLAGRATTPAPPNVGQSTLGAVLGLGEDPHLQSRRWVHTIATPTLNRALESKGLDVFPAAPGLAVESLLAVPARALVVEDRALEQGPWAGAGSDLAPELEEQLTELISTCRARSVLVLRVHSREDEQDSQDDDGSLISRTLEGSVIVAPGTAMFEGTEEGAPASRLVAALKDYVAFEQHSDA